MAIQIYPNKTFYKIIYKDESKTDIEEIDYIGASLQGDLYIERHLCNGTVLTDPLRLA